LVTVYLELDFNQKCNFHNFYALGRKEVYFNQRKIFERLINSELDDIVLKKCLSYIDKGVNVMQEHEEEDKKLKKEKAKIEKGTQPTEITEKKEKLPPRESMEKKENSVKNNLGEIKIAPEVLATIVRRTVSNIAGVAELVTPSKSGFGTLLGAKEIEEGIKVDLTERGEVSVCISVIVEYGAIIIDLAKEIQSVVKSEIEKQTGLLVKSIDVNIMGIQINKKDATVS